MQIRVIFNSLCSPVLTLWCPCLSLISVGFPAMCHHIWLRISHLKFLHIYIYIFIFISYLYLHINIFIFICTCSHIWGTLACKGACMHKLVEAWDQCWVISLITSHVLYWGSLMTMKLAVWASLASWFALGNPPSLPLHAGITGGYQTYPAFVRALRIEPCFSNLIHRGFTGWPISPSPRIWVFKEWRKQIHSGQQLAIFDTKEQLQWNPVL